MRRVRVSVLLALASLPGAAAAQTVEGRVLDVREDVPVAGATVALEDPTGRVLRQVLTFEDGSFWLWASTPGAYQLSVERIGYARVEARPVRLDTGRVVLVEIALQPEAVAVEPLRVVARRSVRPYTTDEFYDRMSRHGDRGRFVTRDQIEALDVGLPSDVLRRVPGTLVEATGRSAFDRTVYLTSYGRRCRPAIYVDGQKRPRGTIDELVSVDRIEGIEVYSGNFIPSGYAVDPESWGCGFILVWRRPDADSRFAFSWGRTLLFGVLGALVLGASFVF